MIHLFCRPTTLLILIATAVCLFTSTGKHDLVRKSVATNMQAQSTNKLVTVNFVVYRKEDGKVITGLVKNQVKVVLDGVPTPVIDFSTPDRPLTSVFLVEYSRIGVDVSSRKDSDANLRDLLESTGPVVARFIKQPVDSVAVIAFDVRATPITTLTSDPQRIADSFSLLLRQSPAVREINLMDALAFVLLGGPHEPPALDKSATQGAAYPGLANIHGNRKVVLLIASGLNTLSKTKYDEIRKISQNAGVPILVIQMASDKDIRSAPGDIGAQFDEADKRLKTIASETGGLFFPSVAKRDIPAIVERINGFVDGQFSVTFAGISDGKAHKIGLKIDFDGDGNPDDQKITVQARQFYNAPKLR